MKKVLCIIVSMAFAPLLWAQEVDSTMANKPETFEMQSGDTTYVMQKYFMVFLKRGSKRSQTKKEASQIQKKHLAHLQQLFEKGKTSITGPFAGDGAIRGIVVFNTATKEEALMLARKDPAVQAGRLDVEVHAFWAAKGSTLR